MPWYRKFQGLMPFRVREALLVSSNYDAFVLEEDGPIADRLFSEYSELNLHSAPRFTHATTAESAMQLLGERRFDIVLTVPRIQGTDAAAFSAMVKEKYFYLPLVLLVFDEADLHQFSAETLASAVDRVFLWTGDAQILLAAIKLIEDARNVHEDTRATGVQVILVVEDQLRSYSTFLPMLYSELLAQAQSLISEDHNDLRRIVRMRARPKILLARTYEDAVAIYREHREHMYAVISDVAFPRDGVEVSEAGVDLARLIREDKQELPLLLQSAAADVRARASAVGAHFVDKNSPSFQDDVRLFLKEVMGFGDFVFRLADRTEVARARDTYQMAQALRTVPAEAIAYHAAHNHFLLWLKARSMFELADVLRDAHIDALEDVEEVRRLLVNLLLEARSQEQAGVITDFSPKYTGPENRFVRIGRGSIGGKGRGLAFVNSLIAAERLHDRFNGFQLRIPKTVVIGTSEFDHFMEDFPLKELLILDDDRAITRALISGRLRLKLRQHLRKAFDALKGPLAVRSSSLLEDSRFQPFAGVYATYMLPNNNPNPEVRFAELCRAVKAVYASAFWREARTYVKSTPHDVDEQKMAVVIQQLVGQVCGDRYYPHLSGVAQSYSFYPIKPQKAEEGIVAVALGLGHMVVGGGATLSFSPAKPMMRPQFPTAQAYLGGSQAQFYALDLARSKVDLLAGPEASLELFDLDVAEADGTLVHAASVLHGKRLREDLSLAGPRVITFNPILKGNAVPLAPALTEIVELLREGIGGEVEIEFAVDLGDLGREVEWGTTPRPPRMYIVQVRPQASPEVHRLDLDLDDVAGADILCSTERALGNGLREDIRDVIYVVRDDVDSDFTRAAVDHLRAINSELLDAGRHYLLIGPGRWGTSDASQGIPIEWAGISGARVICETQIPNSMILPSQGSHFFQNVMANRVGYLTITKQANGFVDRAWLDAMPAEREVSGVRHVRLDEALAVCLDGVKGSAVILKSAANLRQRAGSPNVDVE